MLAGRKPKTVISAVFQRQHFVAARYMWKLYPDFRGNMRRYLTGKGEYPYDITVRTPTGLATIRLYSHDDLLTVNEIFCRQDYPAHSDVRSVVDIGSNIGISARYFLSRNDECTCVLYEPDPRNVERLRVNLQGFESRYRLIQQAVSDEAGSVSFGIEPTGRYGGIGVETGEAITVECAHINDVLALALESSESIDILKLDTEGMEVRTVEAIGPQFLSRISRIYLEANPPGDLHPADFFNHQYGSVRQLVARRDPSRASGNVR